MKMDIHNIDKKLGQSVLDPMVGIKIVSIVKGRKDGYHVAEINKQVKAHVHKKGDEFYHILSGSGTMKIGKVIFKENKPVKIDWLPPINVSQNDVFVVPEGYAHSLKNKEGKPLIIGFICPHSHLDEDRYMVDDPQ
jgi:mannose-6-phosphate isomerase-like protein (cupin superfamily)